MVRNGWSVTGQLVMRALCRRPGDSSRVGPSPMKAKVCIFHLLYFWKTQWPTASQLSTTVNLADFLHFIPFPQLEKMYIAVASQLYL